MSATRRVRISKVYESKFGYGAVVEDIESGRKWMTAGKGFSTISEVADAIKATFALEHERDA